MGKLKPEMQIIHGKRRKKAQSQLKLLEEGKITLDALNSISKKLFYKRLKAGYTTPGKLFAKSRKKTQSNTTDKPSGEVA